MSTVYISSLESDFGKALAKEFKKNGFSVVTEPCGELEYFIDVTECRLPEDDKAVGMGIDPEVLDRAYQENVVKPLQALEKAFHGMTGAKRICFLSSKCLPGQNTSLITILARSSWTGQLAII